MKGSIAILAGGGPAPGINSVISSVAKVFLKEPFYLTLVIENLRHY